MTLDERGADRYSYNNCTMRQPRRVKDTEWQGANRWGPVWELESTVRIEENEKVSTARPWN